MTRITTRLHRHQADGWPRRRVRTDTKRLRPTPFRNGYRWPRKRTRSCA